MLTSPCGHAACAISGKRMNDVRARRRLSFFLFSTALSALVGCKNKGSSESAERSLRVVPNGAGVKIPAGGAETHIIALLVQEGTDVVSEPGTCWYEVRINPSLQANRVTSASAINTQKSISEEALEDSITLLANKEEDRENGPGNLKELANVAGRILVSLSPWATLAATTGIGATQGAQAGAVIGVAIPILGPVSPLVGGVAGGLAGALLGASASPFAFIGVAAAAGKIAEGHYEARQSLPNGMTDAENAALIAEQLRASNKVFFSLSKSQDVSEAYASKLKQAITEAEGNSKSRSGCPTKEQALALLNGIGKEK